MTEYERSTTIQASRKQVEEFVSRIDNLPRYVPTTKNAMPEPGGRVRVQGQAHGHSYDSDGYLHKDDARHRLEWGSDGEQNYRGWLECRGAEQGPVEVVVHLSFDPSPKMSRELASQTGSQDQTIVDGLDKSLQSVKNILEGHGSKVEVPST